MAKDEGNAWAWFIGGLAALGGIALIVKALSEDNELHYQCPNCSYKKLVKGMPECPNCKSKLNWEKVQ